MNLGNRSQSFSSLRELGERSTLHFAISDRYTPWSPFKIVVIVSTRLGLLAEISVVQMWLRDKTAYAHSWSPYMRYISYRYGSICTMHVTIVNSRRIVTRRSREKRSNFETHKALQGCSNFVSFSTLLKGSTQHFHSPHIVQNMYCELERAVK